MSGQRPGRGSQWQVATGTHRDVSDSQNEQRYRGQSSAIEPKWPGPQQQAFGNCQLPEWNGYPHQSYRPRHQVAGWQHDNSAQYNPPFQYADHGYNYDPRYNYAPPQPYFGESGSGYSYAPPSGGRPYYGSQQQRSDMSPAEQQGRLPPQWQARDSVNFGPHAGMQARLNQPVAREDVNKAVQVYAIDVECVATGEKCWDREVAQVAVVDAAENLVLNVYVKPKMAVKSYITELTGLTQDILAEKGVSFDEAMRQFSERVPAGATLLSYNIDSDLKWLQMENKVQKGEVLDLKGCYQQDPVTKKFSRRIWGQDHLARVLLGWEISQHDAAEDALKSMKLWNFYNALKLDMAKHKEALDRVDQTPKAPSFSMKFPQYEGVCMGNRKHCRCRS